MKKLMTLALAAGMLIGAATGASAVEFNAKGTWQFGFGVGDTSLVSKINNGNGKKAVDQDDLFKARQRVRLQLDAVASEALSGTVFFEIGHQNWGKSGNDGAALGADGMIVKVRQAYLDWLVPQTDLKIRMGLQNISLPEAAGDGNVMDNVDTAAIVASYQFNETVGLTAMWARPFNDNSVDSGSYRTDYNNYLDNMDLFMLSLPLSFANNGVKVTPWVMYGMQGKNALGSDYDQSWGNKAGFTPGFIQSNPFGVGRDYNTKKAYGSMFWAGLPIKVTMLDPWNIEFDANYGYVEKMGSYDAFKFHHEVPSGVVGDLQKASTKREGWLVKALVEYKMDWGTPGLFAWYGSGDDSNLKNGSERMPYIYAENKFTSMAGEDVPYTGGFTDMKLSLDGSWGIGAQIKKLSFMEDLHHTIRVAYYGGTNSPKMARYGQAYWLDDKAASTALWDRTGKDLYLTTNDGLLEFDVNTYYKIYDNLNMGLQLSYMVNMMDNDTWVRVSNRSYSRQDAWAADLTFTYSF